MKKKYVRRNVISVRLFYKVQIILLIVSEFGCSDGGLTHHVIINEKYL